MFFTLFCFFQNFQDPRLHLNKIMLYTKLYGNNFLPTLYTTLHSDNPLIRITSFQAITSLHGLNKEIITQSLFDPSMILRHIALLNAGEHLNSFDLTLLFRDSQNYFQGKPLYFLHTVLNFMDKPQYKNFLNELAKDPLFFDFQEKLSYILEKYDHSSSNSRSSETQEIVSMQGV
jgi:hypothetical protein